MARRVFRKKNPDVMALSDIVEAFGYPVKAFANRVGARKKGDKRRGKSSRRRV
jgi:hypothetical protein